MKKIFVIFLFLIKSLYCLEKNTIVYKGKKLNISNKISILEDINKSIKEEDVVRGLHDSEFESYNRNIIYLWNKNVYYVKIDIHNVSSRKKLELYGWLGPIALNRTAITCFYLNDDKIIKSKFTKKINKEDKVDLLNYGHATFEILPNETKTIYVKTKSFLTTPLILTEIEKIIKEERNYFAITNIFNGLSLLIIIIIIIFYIKLRKKYLLYYILVFFLTYLKSNFFLGYLRDHVNFDVHIIYSSAVALYIYFLINFVIDILNLSKSFIEFKNYLNFLKYTTIGLGLAYLFKIISIDYFIQTRGYIYLIIFTIILYVSIKRYKDDWLYKAFLFSWIPQWLLYIYISSAERLKIYTIFSDIRVIEYLEVFVNLFSIAAILVYNETEIKKKYTVEDQEEFSKIINGADNLMHGLLTLIHSYKHDINFNRVKFFRRKIDRENEEVLYYDFSVPLTLTEREEEKKYFDLAKELRKDKFNEYYICDDIQASEIYKNLLPGYKSMMVLRLKFVEGGDLGYVLVLNNNKIEYEYNEVVRDFKYKSSLLVQYFKTIDDIREKYGSIIVEETLRNFHIEVLKDAEKDITSTLIQLDKIKTISNKYIVDNDPGIKRIINLFYDNLEKLMISIKKDLTFDSPDKKTKNKIMFTYSIIEEMLNYLNDIVRKSSNKINIRTVSKVDSDYELYGHIKIVRSIVNHYLTYIYDRVIKNDMETNITITTSLEEGKLKIDTKIENFFISVDDLRKEYNNEVHKVLLSNIRSKLDLRSDNNGVINIIYLLNLLTKEEKKKFNIDHLDYDDKSS